MISKFKHQQIANFFYNSFLYLPGAFLNHYLKEKGKKEKG